MAEWTFFYFFITTIFLFIDIRQKCVYFAGKIYFDIDNRQNGPNKCAGKRPRLVDQVFSRLRRKNNK